MCCPPEQAKSRALRLLTLQAGESIARPASELTKMRLQLATHYPFFSHPRPLFYFSLPQEQQCAETTSESVVGSFLLLRKHFFYHVPGPGGRLEAFFF